MTAANGAAFGASRSSSGQKNAMTPAFIAVAKKIPTIRELSVAGESASAGRKVVQAVSTMPAR